MSLAIFTVSELTALIKKQLESRFSLVQVQGEISNLKVQTSGHIYFTLKDPQAQISAVLFKGNTHDLMRLPKEGDQVTIRGEISVYAPRGNYQLIVRELTYQGVGPLLIKLHELKEKLNAKGWFAEARKKKLPQFPRTIGVVTSPTGAVIQDILNVLTRRFSGIHVILNPVKVQGEGAAQEIAAAIREFNAHHLADVLIVGRGGGSLEDLWAFNEESVAEAIFHSEIPIISAVGHETDFSIADCVADVRAPTPSAAAEIVVAEKVGYLRFLRQAREKLLLSVQTLSQHHSKMLIRAKKHPALISPYFLLGVHIQRADEMRGLLTRALREQLQQKKLRLFALSKQASALKPGLQLSSWKHKFQTVAKALDHAQQTRTLAERKQKLKTLVSHLQAIDPKNLLTKGFCILFEEKKDSIILSSQGLVVGDNVRILLHDGHALATINEKFV